MRGQFPYGPAKLVDDPDWKPDVKESLIDTIVISLFEISQLDGHKPWDRGLPFPQTKEMLVGLVNVGEV